MSHHVNTLTGQIIGSAIEVHRALGPGLLESAYRLSLARELLLRRIPIKDRWPLPLEYKGLKLDKVYQPDLIVADTVVVETKCVDTLAPIYESSIVNLSETWRMESRTVDKLQCTCAEEWHSSEGSKPRRIARSQSWLNSLRNLSVFCVSAVGLEIKCIGLQNQTLKFQSQPFLIVPAKEPTRKPQRPRGR